MRTIVHMRRLGTLAVLIGLVFGGRIAAAEPAQPLPALAAKIDQTSVSGISSGAFMAGQFQIAHAKIVVGAAIIAGGPYGCAETMAADMMWVLGTAMLNLTQGLNGCMLNDMAWFGIPNPDALARRARNFADKGEVDPIADLAEDKVYLFSGSNDIVVAPAIVGKAAEFYRVLGVKPDNIKVVKELPAGHAFITESDGGSCELSAPPFVTHCNYDQAGDLLSHIYGGIDPPDDRAAGAFVTFDQKRYTSGLGEHGMADEGVVFVPKSCRTEPGCKIHVAYHGCAQNRASVGDAFVKGTGFARWADANRIVVLFPEVRASLVNAQGCWDWWGYTGQDYLKRKAPQIVAVYRMIEQLAAPRR